MENQNLPALLELQKQFELAINGIDGIQISNNALSAFQVADTIKRLDAILTDQVMREYFMPLCNRKVGFLTDKDGKVRPGKETKQPYDVATVKDCIIDAMIIGLLPTGNQFNIIAERMYPTKEGYTALLKKIECKYLLNIGLDDGSNQSFAKIPVEINYEWKGEKSKFSITTTVKKDSYSSSDQLRGKAERKAKKVLFEYLTGCDFGDGDAPDDKPEGTIDITSNQKKQSETLSEKAKAASGELPLK